MISPDAGRVALGEYVTGWHKPAASVVRVPDPIERAGARDARMVVVAPNRLGDVLSGAS